MIYTDHLRAGDAEAEVWFEGNHGIHYCVFIQSKRSGSRVFYRVWVEAWREGVDGGDAELLEQAKLPSRPTFGAALDAGTFRADQLALKHHMKITRLAVAIALQKSHTAARKKRR